LEAVAEELALTPAEKEQVRIDVATNGLGF